MEMDDKIYFNTTGEIDVDNPPIGPKKNTYAKT